MTAKVDEGDDREGARMTPTYPARTKLATHRPAHLRHSMERPRAACGGVREGERGARRMQRRQMRETLHVRMINRGAQVSKTEEERGIARRPTRSSIPISVPAFLVPAFASYTRVRARICTTPAYLRLRPHLHCTRTPSHTTPSDNPVPFVLRLPFSHRPPFAFPSLRPRSSVPTFPPTCSSPSLPLSIAGPISVPIPIPTFAFTPAPRSCPTFKARERRYRGLGRPGYTRLARAWEGRREARVSRGR
ncbi:hypothetical protein C8F04DRAFT_1263391 [Mycena alexandri]|uniref:Uncharacterized protein n=1 Tax=Mycena alexandri TaxID=1745969 RepID=A0AAD6SMX9_9AGAR|nr:hypothetical protein C8F04DRAFT_1263391 [Mycena alexandri]